MKNYILYDTTTKEVLRKNPHHGVGIPARLTLADDATPPNPNPTVPERPNAPPRPTNLVYLHDLERPVIDNETQRFDGQEIDEQALTRSWKVATLTQEELDARIPQQVTRRQLFLELNDRGIKRGQIKQMIGNNEPALIEFEEAGGFEIDHPLVINLATQLGVDRKEIFRNASVR